MMSEHERRLPIHRRTLLATIGVVALAGCLGDDDERPAAIDLTGEKFCDQCGMLIEAQPGPAGQVFYDGDVPDDREPPAWFCSGWCTYTYTFDRRADGVGVTVMYLTDYSGVDWSTSSEDGLSFISAHLEAAAFADADELTLVVGSELRGSMGPDLIGFSDQDDAATFQDSYGGEQYRHDAVTPELVGSLM